MDHLDPNMLRDTETKLRGAVAKLKASMDSGPKEYGGEDAVLDPSEATLLYRFLTEGAGCRF